MNFNEIFGKNSTYDDIKSDKKALYSLQTVYFLKYVLRIKVWYKVFFLNGTSIFVFAELTFYLNKNQLRKNC